MKIHLPKGVRQCRFCEGWNIPADLQCQCDKSLSDIIYSKPTGRKAIMKKLLAREGFYWCEDCEKIRLHEFMSCWCVKQKRQATKPRRKAVRSVSDEVGFLEKLYRLSDPR